MTSNSIQNRCAVFARSHAGSRKITTRTFPSATEGNLFGTTDAHRSARASNAERCKNKEPAAAASRHHRRRLKQRPRVDGNGRRIRPRHRAKGNAATASIAGAETSSWISVSVDKNQEVAATRRAPEVRVARICHADRRQKRHVQFAIVRSDRDAHGHDHSIRFAIGRPWWTSQRSGQQGGLPLCAEQEEITSVSSPDDREAKRVGPA